ncbi:8-amino-7-oxononanoate synthase [Pararhizobium antarcticum]|uniref:8-amino-7-oxononanoate synthase n=1 Tax=Pararhizobium antarcticum TaxID=1798805 RepID=A0A657LRL7_9HYPH|nr:8-amino-7-oxononanoate synthase [Pararhizobium antarcticum]OJF96264.1 8-amino-7-oxononanoate synthase [Pararhizobium antarcticum]OJF96363.1 8-amino-7-oxononanoate synthase [Rhizobium sp. 58]
MSAGALMQYRKSLSGLERKGRLRTLLPQAGADFTSNDYLALAAAPRIRAALSAALAQGLPAGAGGSRLLRGNHPEHVALEEEAAAFFGVERVLYFGSGYAANTALFATLPQRGDLIVHDALVHASAHDGIRASRAPAVSVSHNDVAAFETAIVAWRRSGATGHPWIAVESLYSMDGDRAPLAALADLADRHDGFLVIDEAHATGVFGAAGRGLAAELERRSNIIVLHTCGKALGASGALVGASGEICDYLINRARSFIYATAPSPLMAVAVREALKLLSDEPDRLQDFAALRTFANAELEAVLGLEGSGSQILPVRIGDNGRAASIAARMRAKGFDIRAIRPPTVPEGTSRLRIAITLNVDRPMIRNMFADLAGVMAEIPA